MNARTAWDLWRRVLREDALQAALLGGELAARAGALGLSGEEREIALAYARTPDRTRWAVETYRYRSTKVVVEAVEFAAPLTARLLRRRGLDLDAVAREYLAAVGWADAGPRTYATCAAVLEHLARALGGGGDAELDELVAFEGATVALLRSLAGRALAPPRPEDAEAVEARGRRFAQTGRGVALTTRLDLAPWLRDPDSVGLTALAEEARSYLRFVRSSEEAPALLALSERALSLYRQLAAARTLPELAERVGEGDPARVAGALRRFVTLGVVGPVA